MNNYYRSWPITLLLTLISLPLLIMFIFQIIDNFTNPAPGGIWPSSFTLEHWRFLWETPKTGESYICLLYTSPSPRDPSISRMPSSA